MPSPFIFEILNKSSSSSSSSSYSSLRCPPHHLFFAAAAAALSLFLVSTSTCSSSTSRFNKIPCRSMSLSNPNPNPNPNPKKPIIHFTNPQSLSEWLKPRLPSDSFASWGVNPGTKNIHNLWLELSQGETCLQDSIPPIRTLQVLSLRIFHKQHNTLLIESHQQLSDGSIRIRNRPLSEKLKPYETPQSAVYRAVKEELGSILHGDCREIVKIIPDSYQMKIEERDSSISYPGLPACYVLHSMDVWVEGLPEGEFWTEEEDEYEHDGIADKPLSVNKHYWKWVDPHSLQNLSSSSSSS